MTVTQEYLDLLLALSSKFGEHTYDSHVLPILAVCVISISRLRWAFQSEKIISHSTKKFEGQPWRLARGDKDVIIFPTSFIPELNKLPSSVLNSRRYHSDNVISGLVGMDVIRLTNHHVKVLLGRISPAIPQLLQPTAQRTAAAIERLFPQKTDEWTLIEPLDIVVECVTEGIALALVGPAVWKSPDFVHTLCLHTKLTFTIAFIMRCVPKVLQPILVWLLPYRWQLRRTWKSLDDYVIPEIRRRQQERSADTYPDLVSWMIEDGRTAIDKDPRMLTRLVGAVGVGGTYSTANFVTGMILDLTEHPEILEQVRQEIAEQHEKCNGHWDQAAFNSLDRLESAMKETSRLAPGSFIVYGRNVEQDYTLSNGLSLKKGQALGVSYLAKSMDPRVFDDYEDYKGMRFYDSGLEDLRARPFRSIDGEILTWGSGRHSCPGRFIANLSAKIALVKILDEYDFKLVDGKRPGNGIMHDFTFVHPKSQLMIRRREKTLGIKY
ncbi:putative cytochrome P450 [Annulohypoxylon maeteangense]|uniref:putative cytochrome P450 n=1 Tax=Annulohypoxylon maeteangense TaxID=1927788 RepID=UPI002007DE42|nr:putative cytochrome P450 [Annulohypoxylon maeteangense]KAI0889801.1 putative cytochrome P450 [Annulohypoxylon maeteangense]